MMVVQTCRHCNARPASKAQRLCYRCWRTPGVYCPMVFEWPGVGWDNTLNRPPPAEPTDATPGSREKLAVLIERAEREERLWHNNDARIGDAV